MNKAILIGRLTKEPELRYTSSNIACSTFTLAVSRDYTNQNGEREADFISIQVWKKLAENCSKYLAKGSKVAIDGRIQTRSHDDKNGNKRYVTEVVAENVQFLDSKKDGQAIEVQNESPSSQQSSQTDPYADMGRQVSMDDYPNIDKDSLPF